MMAETSKLTGHSPASPWRKDRSRSSRASRPFWMHALWQFAGARSPLDCMGTARQKKPFTTRRSILRHSPRVQRRLTLTKAGVMQPLSSFADASPQGLTSTLHGEAARGRLRDCVVVEVVLAELATCIILVECVPGTWILAWAISSY